MSLEDALANFESFSGGAPYWSGGKDELNMVAISCYIAGIQPPIPANRFDNAVKLLAAAGMPMEDLVKTPSNKLADYYQVEHPPLHGHDALDDALSLAYTLQHLMKAGILRSEAFELAHQSLTGRRCFSASIRIADRSVGNAGRSQSSSRYRLLWRR